jgi:phosphoribosyl 1,2-cyclic phosphodiesterase
VKLLFCPLFSGSGGNAAYVATSHTRLLVDAGMSALAIGRALSGLGASLSDVDGVLVTHEHSDHVKGILTLARRYGLCVYANEKTWLAMSAIAAKVPSPQMRVFETGQDFYIKDIAVRSFPIPHDAAEPVGFRLYAGGKTVCTMTDLGAMSKDLLREASGADVVLIESNHDVELLRCGPYPAHLKRRILSKHGHLSNADAGSAVGALAKSGVRRFYLGHLSAQNNREELALRAASGAIASLGLALGRDIALAVAKKDGLSPATLFE